MLAASVVLGLGVAQPALASEGVDPEPPELVLPAAGPQDVLPAAVPLSDIAPEAFPIPSADEAAPAEPPITVDLAQGDAGDLSASVRILSPGADGPAPLERAESAAVSDAAQPDITTGRDPASASPSSPTDSSAPSEPTGHGTASGGANINVSVRVLSPGDNGPVTQSSTRAAAAPDPTPSEERPSSSFDSASGSLNAAADPSQYQQSNSQYQSDPTLHQSDPTTRDDSWKWVWVLTVDCAGNADSLSSETGSPTSLVWVWNWSWYWACERADTGDPSALADAIDSSSLAAPKAQVDDRSGAAEPGSITPSPDPAASAARPAANESSNSAPSNEAWTWNWSFTFCGKATSIQLLSESATALNWTWDWAWIWTCGGEGSGAAVGPAAESRNDPAPLSWSIADATAVPDPAPVPSTFVPTVNVSLEELPLPLPLPPVPARPVVPAVAWTMVTVAGQGAAVRTAVVPTFAPPPIPQLSIAVDVLLGGTAPAASRAAQRRAASSAKPDRAAPPRGGGGIPQTPVHEASVDASREQRSSLPGTRPKPAPEPRAHPVSARPAPGPLAPIGLPHTFETVGGGASGGPVPSALVTVVAALIGFIMLAAPPLGRRIRVARELRPRSRYRSSIDEPG